MKSNKKTTLCQAIQKQERSRQKQITILYASGRHIFNNNDWKVLTEKILNNELNLRTKKELKNA